MPSARPSVNTDRVRDVLQGIRRSLALKLILVSAMPSAAVLLLGLWGLINHSQKLALIAPERAFAELRQGAVLGALLTLTFAGVAVALAARHYLLKPIQALMLAMRRAEAGEILIRAKVDSHDELGMLATSFNSMLAKVTDMAVAEIEQQQKLTVMERELVLQGELKQANAQLGEHAREMELVLEVARSLSGTLDLREQLEELGRHTCLQLGVNEFSVLLIDEGSQQLVMEAVAGRAPSSARGMRFSVGEGVVGDAVARAQTIYVPDVDQDPRYLHYKGLQRSTGSFLSVPLQAKGRVVGVMNLSRPEKAAFQPQEIRIAEAIAAQAGLAIQNARLYAQMLELSYTDVLTGVPNRRQLFQRLEQEWTRSLRFGDELSILMIDLDRFKQVNDQHGHTVGDAVLRGVALALERNVRKVDTVARFGGEEFCIVLPRIAKVEALEVAEKLRRSVSQTPLETAPGKPPMFATISIGVASYGADAADAAALLDLADQALYEAKRSGRNTVRSA